MFVTLANDSMSVTPSNKVADAVTAYGDLMVGTNRENKLKLSAFTQDLLMVPGDITSAGDQLVIGDAVGSSVAVDYMTVEESTALLNRAEVVANFYVFSNKDIGIRLDDEYAFKYLESRQTFFWG